jgi:protein SCO1
MMLRSFLLAWAISFALSFPVMAHDHSAMPHAAPSDASLYNLSSRWTDQDGHVLTLRDLAGRKTVVAMGYTSCPDICPLIVANMAAIEKAAKGRNLRFVFVTLDSKGDAPEKLKAYADAHGLDPADWTLLNGDDKAVRDLAAVLGVRYKSNGEGGFDHSAILTLLDEKGEVVFQKPDMQVDPQDFAAHIPR